MLINLIENASRHSGAGTHVRLELHPVAGAARFCISDDGRGIPAEKYDEVFQPFRRLEADRHTPGSGLGLTLVRAVATRHHARIEMGDNAPGLKVVVTFPAMRAPS